MKKISAMDYLFRIIVLIWLMLTINPGTVPAYAENTLLPDSLLTDDYVYEYTFSDFDKAVHIMGELRKRGAYSPFRLDVTEGDLYFNTGRYLQALKFYKRVLESEEVQKDDTEYMEQVHRMISCYDCLHDDARKAVYVKLLLQKAEECGNREMKSVALFNMGKMVYYQEDRQRGYDMIDEAISLMKQSDYKYKYDNLRYDYNTLLIMQQRDRMLEEALQTLDELDKVVTESTNQEPGIEGLAEKEKKTLYAQRAVLLSRLGRTQEADEAYRAWQAIGKAYSKDDYLIVPYLMDRKRYDEVINMYTLRESFLNEHRDTISYHMVGVKRSLAKAYEGKKDYKQSSKYFEELADLTDSLKVREQRSSAIELATVYETHEREAELQEQTRKVKNRTVLLLSSGGALILLLVLFFRNMQYIRTVRRKNVAMVKSIQKLRIYKEELSEARNKIRRLSERNVADAPMGSDMFAEPGAVSCTCMGYVPDSDEEKENRLLFLKLDDIITREKLFLNPMLSRDELMKLIHVNKNRLGKILQQNVKMNTVGYINSKRLEYAIQLLDDVSCYTITSVAEACGIPNTSTFNRLFRTKFGMTPTEYRNGLKTFDDEADEDEQIL